MLISQPPCFKVHFALSGDMFAHTQAATYNMELRTAGVLDTGAMVIDKEGIRLRSILEIIRKKIDKYREITGVPARVHAETLTLKIDGCLGETSPWVERAQAVEN